MHPFGDQAQQHNNVKCDDNADILIGSEEDSHDNIHKISYCTLMSKDHIESIHTSRDEQINSNSLNLNIEKSSSQNNDSLNNRNNDNANYISNISQITVNDTTISSSENDILLDPLSFDDNGDNNNGNVPNIYNVDVSSLSVLQNPLTLNDLDSVIKGSNKPNEDEIDDIKDHVHDYLNIVGIENNQLTLNDIYIDLNSDFNMGFNFDLCTDTDSSMSFPILRQLNIQSPNNSQPNSKSGTADSHPLSNISNISYSNSNLDTPHSQLLNNNDISINRLKRSFTRLKQTSELINTEKVYICSLKILEQVYLNHFMSNTVTPIYFDIFKNCVTQLLKNHQTFYDDLNKIYTKWYNDSISLFNDSSKFNLDTNNAKSPNFDKFNYVSNEKEYLEGVVKLLSNNSIDVETYSIYCSLYQRIVQFSSSKGIENFRRGSMIILNDYLVQNQNLEADYFVDQHLDTRFISVVQMPTNRMVRYKLILQSLLKHIDVDEKNSLQVNYYTKTMDKINLKIDQIDSFVGNEDSKLEKLSNFKKLVSNNSRSNLPNSLFLENLENLQLSSSFGVVFPIQSKHCHIQSEYLCGFLFKSHLIFAKPSNLISNSLDIKFIIPLLSIFNELDDHSCNMFSSYEHLMNLRFENNFNIYEISLVFPDEKEKLLWKGQLKVNLDKIDGYNLSKTNKFDKNHEFLFSDLQSKILSIGLNPEIEKFDLSSYIPQTMVSFIRFNDGVVNINDNSYSFELDHFFSDSNHSPPNKISRRDSTTSINSHYLIDNEAYSIRTKNSIMNNNIATPLSSLSNKIQTVKITLQDRVFAQTCIKSVWSQQFQIYTLNQSISRSLSNLFHSKMSMLSLNGINNNNVVNDIDNISNTPGTPTGTFIPPSPSFALSSPSLGSPIKLRNVKSMRGLRDVGRNSISSAIRNNGLPPTPSSYMNEELRSENTNGNSTPNHHIIKHSGSLRSLSSFIGNGMNSSAKSIMSSAKTINEKDTNFATVPSNDKEEVTRRRGISTSVSLVSVTTSIPSSTCKSANSSATIKKGTNTVSKFWRSFKQNKKAKG